MKKANEKPEKLEIFLSWSGPRSKAIAVAFFEWLPKVFQMVEPWVSFEDVDKGARWNQVIASTLERNRFGIICLTSDNLRAPWIHFEAGALAKVGDARVWTYLLGLEYKDVEPPLAQFNHTIATRDDTAKLVRAINVCLSVPLTDHLLSETFEIWWPQLNKSISEIPSDEAPANRPLDQVLTEVLTGIRELQAKLLPRHDSNIQDIKQSDQPFHEPDIASAQFKTALRERMNATYKHYNMERGAQEMINREPPRLTLKRGKSQPVEAPVAEPNPKPAKKSRLSVLLMLLPHHENLWMKCSLAIAMIVLEGCSKPTPLPAIRAGAEPNGHPASDTSRCAGFGHKDWPALPPAYLFRGVAPFLRR